MVTREKQCQYCKKYFFFDDGIDEGTPVESQIKRIGYCPECIDPREIATISYDKEDIIEIFKEYLSTQNITVDVLDEDTILGMLREFPKSYALYNSNSNYRTFNLHNKLRFTGVFGEFELGDTYCSEPVRNTGRYQYLREIICVRCQRKTQYPKTVALKFFLGVKNKYCQTCDVNDIPRNTSGLNRNGSEKSEYSDRALAKALNVSRMDYRRRNITKPVPALPIGTISGCYEIKSAYWDENPASYSPKYMIECMKCHKTFHILQKRLKDTIHYCEAEGKVIR